MPQRLSLRTFTPGHLTLFRRPVRNRGLEPFFDQRKGHRVAQIERRVRVPIDADGEDGDGTGA
jgi:hypothetical protein